MWPSIYRLVAVTLMLIGVTLIVLVWRAVYTSGRAADALVFQMGMPLVLLSALAAAALLIAAGLLFAAANHRQRNGG
ncbi:MAG: hypothetical protein ACHP84_19265 [Caulobacterales bacterium]|jgi:hypothetical protein